METLYVMLGLTYALLLAGGALAHYSTNGFDRNLVEREEPQHEGLEIVECPVCETLSGLISSREECPIIKDGKRYKLCKYGAYVNKACGNRFDCFRGPNERCTEKLTDDPLDQRCARGYYCSPAVGVCTGLGYDVDTPTIRMLVPNNLWSLDNHRHRRADDILHPIREKRHV